MKLGFQPLLVDQYGIALLGGVAMILDGSNWMCMDDRTHIILTSNTTWSDIFLCVEEKSAML